jgi:hypothetical protein
MSALHPDLRMTVPRIFCAGPEHIRRAADPFFGKAPFPSPAIAKPAGTDVFCGLSHGYQSIVRQKPLFVNLFLSFVRIFSGKTG